MTVCEAIGEDVRKSYNTAIALEIFQQWILIHDDVEDYSEERRGKQCFHRIYGVPLTVNTGDALHISMAEKCTTGQSKELEWIEMKKWNVTEEDYYEMAKRKHHGTQSQLHAGLVQ